VLALRDGYPVSRGHSLMVPRRHVGSFGEASLEEQSAMLAMSQRVRALLDKEPHQIQSFANPSQSTSRNCPSTRSPTSTPNPS